MNEHIKKPDAGQENTTAPLQDKIGEYVARINNGETMESFGTLPESWTNQIYERLHAEHSQERKIEILKNEIEGEMEKSVDEFKSETKKVEAIENSVQLTNTQDAEAIKQELQVDETLHNLDVQVEDLKNEEVKKVEQLESAPEGLVESKGLEAIKDLLAEVAKDNYLFTHITGEETAKALLHENFSVSMGTGISSTLSLLGNDSASLQIQRILEGNSPHRGQTGMVIIAVPKNLFENSLNGARFTTEKFEDYLVESGNINGGSLVIPQEFNLGYLNGDTFFSKELETMNDEEKRITKSLEDVALKQAQVDAIRKKMHDYHYNHMYKGKSQSVFDSISYERRFDELVKEDTYYHSMHELGISPKELAEKKIELEKELKQERANKLHRKEQALKKPRELTDFEKNLVI